MAGRLDSDLENELVQMLSGLEYIRANLEEQHMHKRPVHALETLTTLVNQVVAFANNRLDASAYRADLASTLAKAGDFFTSAQQAREQFGGSGLKSWFGLFSRSATSRGERRQLFHTAVQGVPEVLEGYFVLFMALFQTPAAVQAWTETYGVFLADLRRVLDKLDC
jgi:hypothetical protein